MRAILCPSSPLPPSGLLYTPTHPKPLPKPGHVLIRVKAFGLNRSELFTRQGHSPGVQFPRVLGIECVGVVEDAGGGRWDVGDVVAAVMGGMGRQFDGGYAEYTLVPQSQVSPPITLPKDMTYAEFGAIPETFLTAWATLHHSLHLTPTTISTLLIRGGTTALGIACLSLSKSPLFNCPLVITTTRSPQKALKLKELGADHVLIDDGDVAEKVKALTGGKGADRCVELIGPPTLVDSAGALADDGWMSQIGVVGDQWALKSFDPMITLAPHKHLTVYTSASLDVSLAPLQWIVDAVARGEVKLGLDRVFRMEQAREAHAYMEANRACGKVVCVVDDED